MEMKNNFENYYTEMLEAVGRMNTHAKFRDIPRNHFNYGVATTLAYVLSDMGHRVHLDVYEDRGYVICAYIDADGRKIEVLK